MVQFLLAPLELPKLANVQPSNFGPLITFLLSLIFTFSVCTFMTMKGARFARVIIESTFCVLNVVFASMQTVSDTGKKKVAAGVIFLSEVLEVTNSPRHSLLLSKNDYQSHDMAKQWLLLLLPIL